MSHAGRSLPDHVADGFRPEPTIDWAFLARAADPEATPDAIMAFFAVAGWDDLELVAGAAVGGASASTNNQSFMVLDDGRVAISDDAGDVVVVSRPAFVGLMLRLLDVVLDAAENAADAVVATPRWSALIEARDRLRAEHDAS